MIKQYASTKHEIPTQLLCLTCKCSKRLTAAPE